MGLVRAAGDDAVFEQLVIARIIEPSSKLDASRVLDQAGVRPVSCPTLKRRLRTYAEPAFRRRLSGDVSARPDRVRQPWSCMT